MLDKQAPDRGEFMVAVLFFGVVLGFHLWAASVGWSNLNLPGQEFRQAQTALSAHFIQKEDDFSLAYPTPVLGKPWSIPMEFPLYQWTVVVVSNTTGMALTQSGRVVSLVCFYLTLPALYLLLRRLGLPRSRSLVVLALVVCCPLYIFYARAFLIETMAWMFGSWFLLAYVKATEQRSLSWGGLAALMGVGGGLVKVTTLIFFLMPALAWTLYWFWNDWCEGAGRWRRLGVRAAWCGALVLPPLAAAIGWVWYSDAIKAQSVTGAFLQSSSLSGYNFGVGVRWSADVWAQHWAVFMQDLTSVPVLIACSLVALACARRWWGLILLSLFFFLLIQAVFPILYAWHEYYYVANAMMLMLALGLALVGVLESRVPRWLAWGMIVCVAGAQVGGYLSHHYPDQKEHSHGGSPLTAALKAVTAPDDVIITAGADWNSIVPYYAQRRALMIRRGLETSWETISPAFDALRGEQVGALVLVGDQRGNQALIELAREHFHLEPKISLLWQDAEVYLQKHMLVEPLEDLKLIPGLTFGPDVETDVRQWQGREIDVSAVPFRYRQRFARMSPMPWKYYTTFGSHATDYEGGRYYAAHPDTRLWFKAVAGARRMKIEIMMLPEAYDESLEWWNRSDGVELVVTAKENGAEHRLFARHLHPRGHPPHRGLQQIEFEFSLAADADIELAVLAGPDGNYARDWTVLGDVRIE